MTPKQNFKTSSIDSAGDPAGPFPELPDETPEALLKRSIATYDQIASLYEARWFDFWKQTHAISVFNVLLGKLKPSSAILDIGSGVGDIAAFFVEAGHNVTCVDLSKGMLATVKKRVPTARCIEMDMRKLCFEGQKFDLIVISHALPFLTFEDVAIALNEAHEALAPGGYLYISACGKDAGIREWKSDQGVSVGNVFLHHINASICVETLQKLNANIISLEEFGAPRNDFYIVSRRR